MRGLRIVGIFAFWAFAAWCAFVVLKKDDYWRQVLGEIRAEYAAEVESTFEAGLPEFPSKPAIVSKIAEEASGCATTKVRLRLRPNDLVLYRASFGMLGGKRIVGRKVTLQDSQHEECLERGLNAAEPLMEADLKRTIAELLLKGIVSDLSGR